MKSITKKNGHWRKHHDPVYPDFHVIHKERRKEPKEERNYNYEF
jgi:hypothetical protein